jgi:16S rRNA (guanine527-N7)-methyltransferase
VTAGPALGSAQRAALERVLAELRSEPASVSSVREPGEAWRVHVADSLSGLEVADLAAADRIADIGAGAGFPGLPLAVALPAARVDLIESVGRKCAFIERAAAAAAIRNATAVCARAEEWAAGEGAEAYGAATARAVGPLRLLAELASPLLRRDGVLIAWKGARDSVEEAELAAAAPALGMRPEDPFPVRPFAGSRRRHLHVVRKIEATPLGLPRRPGVAARRPFRAPEP